MSYIQFCDVHVVQLGVKWCTVNGVQIFVTLIVNSTSIWTKGHSCSYTHTHTHARVQLRCTLSGPNCSYPSTIELCNTAAVTAIGVETHLWMLTSAALHVLYVQLFQGVQTLLHNTAHCNSHVITERWSLTQCIMQSKVSWDSTIANCDHWLQEAKIVQYAIGPIKGEVAVNSWPWTWTTDWVRELTVGQPVKWQG